MDNLDVIFWGALAALAFVGELLSVSFFLVFFSFGALAALVLGLLGFGLVAQSVVFVAASVASALILRPTLLNRLSAGGEDYRRHRGVEGSTGVVTEAIEPGGKGTVRIGSGEFWSARAMYGDERIQPGVRVRVLDTDGLTALVDVVEDRGKEA